MVVLRSALRTRRALTLAPDEPRGCIRRTSPAVCARRGQHASTPPHSSRPPARLEAAACCWREAGSQFCDRRGAWFCWVGPSLPPACRPAACLSATPGRPVAVQPASIAVPGSSCSAGPACRVGDRLQHECNLAAETHERNACCSPTHHRPPAPAPRTACQQRGTTLEGRCSQGRHRLLHARWRPACCNDVQRALPPPPATRLHSCMAAAACGSAVAAASKVYVTAAEKNSASIQSERRGQAERQR